MSSESVPSTVREIHQRGDAFLEEERQKNELATRPAEGPGSKPLQPKMFQHNFFDPEVAHLRRIYFKIVGMTVVLVISLMWICFSVYWGSLGELTQHSPNLKCWLVNRDGDGALGQAMMAAFEANSKGVGTTGNQHMSWIIMDGSSLPTNDDVAFGVIDEQVWAAVIVNANATSTLETARTAGDSSYNPTSAITFYYNQGRNEIAANNFIVPYTSALLTQTLSSFAMNFTAQYVVSVSGGASNAAEAFSAIGRAPQTVSMPFWYRSVNLRPYTKTVSQAVLLVGQIYIAIFAFIVTMANDAARGIIAPFLRFRSYAKLRLVVPLVAYIPISFSCAMINLPFKVTFGAKYGYGGGFFIFWLFAYMGVLALGLSTEAMVTVLTARFAAYFIIVLVIFNVSCASVPFELQPGFYRYGHGFPVFNLGQAIRTITFNTKSHLPRNAGVILAWIVLNLITIPLFTWLMRRNAAQERESRVLDEEKRATIDMDGTTDRSI